MFNNYCIICNKKISSSFSICESCFPKKINREECCDICGIETSRFVTRCSQCKVKTHINVRNYSIYPYVSLAQDIIAQFKFKKDYSYAEFYSMEIIDIIKKNYNDYTVCFIPTSFIKRKIKNGYQLDSIIKILRKNKIPVKNLIRKKYGKTQKKLNKKEREDNLVNRFTLKSKKTMFNKILLIDDVYTTGATINACSKILGTNQCIIDSLTLYRD